MARLNHSDLSEYIDKLAVEAEEIETYLIDLTLASNGTFQYDDLLQMPIEKINTIYARLEKKIKADSGIKGTEYL